MSVADPVAIAVQMGGIFERLGVRYILGGSLASVAFGEPRATLDVDMAVDLTDAKVAEFVAAVDSDFFVDLAWVTQEVRRRGSFQLVHRSSMIRVDIFVPEWTGSRNFKHRFRPTRNPYPHVAPVANRRQVAPIDILTRAFRPILTPPPRPVPHCDLTIAA